MQTRSLETTRECGGRGTNASARSASRVWTTLVKQNGVEPRGEFRRMHHVPQMIPGEFDRLDTEQLRQHDARAVWKLPWRVSSHGKHEPAGETLESMQVCATRGY
jgi:hypothetical protein